MKSLFYIPIAAACALLAACGGGDMPDTVDSEVMRDVQSEAKPQPAAVPSPRHVAPMTAVSPHHAGARGEDGDSDDTYRAAARSAARGF